MAVPGIEHRIAALEADVARLKEQLAKAVPAQGDWLDEIYGAFGNDPIYEEAMRLGREYRESQRPRAARKTTRDAVKRTAKRHQR